MKKLITFLAVNFILFSQAFAADIPHGMKYQAVARDKKGDILANKEIYLKISLLANQEKRVIYYTEMHKITTNQVGLFSIVIGEGIVLTGTFDLVPWSTEEMWMEIAMSEKDESDFTIINASKLYTVPYAFVAGSIAKPKDLSGANNRIASFTNPKIAPCQCDGGIKILQVLYLGASGVTVRVYRKNNPLAELVNTFTNVNNGDILTFNASAMSGGKFNDLTYVQVIGIKTSVTCMNTECNDFDSWDEAYVAGETFDNFSVLSHTDIKGMICTACDVKQNWKVGGNVLYDVCNLLGTKSNTDLVIITNNIERMRIFNTGNINITNSLNIGNSETIGNNLDVGNDISVRKNANFNTLGGATTIYGPLTVGNVSPTILTGTLRVDRLTDLNKGLNVNNSTPTLLTGTLRVNNATDLFGPFTVNNNNPSILTGTLTVTLDAILKEHVYLSNPTHNSFTTTTGALVVEGGVGIVKNLNVGGDANFGGHTTFAGPVNVTDATQSTSCTTGALIVAGGTGIGSQLFVCGLVKFNSTLDVTGATNLFNTLNVAGATTLSSTLAVTGATNLFNTLAVSGATTLSSTLGVTGATTLSSTLGVTGATTLSSTLNVTGVTTLGDKLNANGQVTINACPGGGESAYSAYPLQIQGCDQGIAIKVTGNRQGSNNFISFWDESSGGTMWGRIEGQTLTELHDDTEYKLDLASKIYDVVSGAIDITLATVNLAEVIAFQIEADASVNVCAGLGIVACPPILSFVIGSIAEVVVAAVEEALVIAETAVAATNLGLFVTNKDNNVGVSYQSGAGDYAECLLRADEKEKIYPGDIVGVKGGKISKNTTGSEKIMVISHKPIVLGNLPQPKDEKKYEKVAFMGQVPVHVFGIVNIGDYIIPNGVNNGVGVAVAPDKIQAEDIKNIVGIAWSSSSEILQIHDINVAVGINVNDNQKVIDDQQKQIFDLKNEIAQTNNQLEKLIPGFKSSSNSPVNTQLAPSSSNVPIAAADKKQSGQNDYTPVSANDIHYYEITKNDLVKGFDMAQENMKDKGTYEKNKDFWNKYNSDPAYKEFMINNLFDKCQKQLAVQKKLDARFK